MDPLVDDAKTVVFFSVGNPGPMNRHSAGHMVLQQLITEFGAKQLVKKSVYSITSFENLVFVKSNSYMNESNRLLKAYLDGERVNLQRLVLVVVYDDFEVNVPRVRISLMKKNESHNGIKAIQNFLSSQSLLNTAIYKLGVGVGPKPQNATKDTVASWVLSSFKMEEKQKIMDESMPLVFGYVSYILENGVINDCNKLNSRLANEYK